MYIPKDAILMLSGVSCVGKTTTAYEIVKNYPEFRRVSEYDLMRTVVRTAYEYLAEEAYIDKNKLKSKYNALFKSITSNQPLAWLTEHVIFINLYLSDEEEHISRRQSRSEERDYHESVNKTETIISQSRAEKNQLLHMQAIKLHQIFKNVFSIDVSNCTPNHAASKIMEFVFDYFNNYN